jgi:twitching motility protein PilT
VAAIDDYLRILKEQGATALHLSTARRPMLRVKGDLVPLQGKVLLDDLSLRALLTEAVGADRWETFLRERDCDFTTSISKHGRYHVNCAVTEAGFSSVFEPVRDVAESLDLLGLPGLARELISARSGLVIVCGPDGSGKSTTIASLVNDLNVSRPLHIVTIESPIGTLHRSQRSVVSQREVGRHTDAFPGAIRAALKQDADVITISELSERDAVTQAIDAAQQGALVIAEAHTPTAVSAIEGVLSAFPEDARMEARVALSDNLRGVIGQVLCRRKDGGRVAAYEVITNGGAVLELISSGANQELEELLESPHDGVQRLDDALLALVASGVIEGREGYRRARDKKRFSQHAPPA